MRQQIEILEFIAANEPVHGFRIHRSDLGIPLGSVYTSLQRMQDKGWIWSRLESVDDFLTHRGRRRVLYRTTKKGRAELARMMQ